MEIVNCGDVAELGVKCVFIVCKKGSDYTW